GLGLRRNDLPVPAHLGVRAGYRGDDSRGCPRLPGRHGTNASREARPAVALVPHPPGARHVPRDGRHLAHLLFRIPLRLRRHPRLEARDRRRLSLAVSRSEGLRPAGVLREGGPTRPIFRGTLERLDDRAAERTSDGEPGEGGWTL